MVCPYCEQQMEEGYITSQTEISWKKDLNRFGRAFFHDDAVILARLPLVKTPIAVAHLCRNCEKVIIDYKDGASDFNHKDKQKRSRD